MKTPIDATGHSGSTVALLSGGSDFQMVDMWVITLNGGTVIRWHSAASESPQASLNSLTFNAASPYGGTYALGPLIDRGKITTKLGLEVATLDMKISATTSDLINGSPIIPFAVGRGFDGASVMLLRGYIPAWATPLSATFITGATIEFSGRVTALKNVGRTTMTLTVSAWTVLLNVNMGPDVYQSNCLNQHYDANCGLTPTNINGAALSGGSTTAFGTNLTAADGYYTKGIIAFTSGANTGIKRAVQSYANAGGAINVAFGFPFAPAAGDTFTIARGCLLTFADCKAQRSTTDAEEHYRGQPFTPVAITGALGV